MDSREVAALVAALALDVVHLFSGRIPAEINGLRQR